MTAIVAALAAVLAALWLVKQVYALRARVAEAAVERTRQRANASFVGRVRGSSGVWKLALVLLIWLPIFALAASLTGKS